MRKQMLKLGKAITVIIEGKQRKINLYALLQNVTIKFKYIGESDKDFTSVINGSTFKDYLNLSMGEPSFTFEYDGFKINGQPATYTFGNDEYFSKFMDSDKETKVPTGKLIKASKFTDVTQRELYQNICIGSEYISATTGYCLYRYKEQFNLENLIMIHVDSVAFLNPKEDSYVFEYEDKDSNEENYKGLHAIRQGNMTIYTPKRSMEWLNITKVIPTNNTEFFDKVNLKQFTGLLKTEEAKAKLKGIKKGAIDLTAICENSQVNPCVRIDFLQLAAKVLPIANITVSSVLAPVMFQDSEYKELVLVCPMKRKEKENDTSEAESA